MEKDLRIEKIKGYFQSDLFHSDGYSGIEGDVLLMNLGFAKPEDFLYWISDLFSNNENIFDCYCGKCASLLPNFIKYCEKNSGLYLNDIIKNSWSNYTKEQKDRIYDYFMKFFKNTVVNAVDVKRFKDLEEFYNQENHDL